VENQGLPIIDCHQHFIDSRHLRYPVFMQRSAGFEALVGDYSALPKVYLPEDYARDVNGLGVVKTVWAEFISDDPMGEVTWAQELAHTTGRPQGMIGLVDFSSPEIEAHPRSLHLDRARSGRPSASRLASNESAAPLCVRARTPVQHRLAGWPRFAP
jgi:predicted TIM-barrel fold metal-dependent hydrolase